MFYVADKVLTYPCKSILEDVLSREGAATKESFSPFHGLNKLMMSLTRGNGNIPYTVKEIISSGRRDFSANKARPNDDGADREDSAYEVSDYYRRLEDIDDDFVVKYVKQVLTGFLWDENGKRRIDGRFQTFELWEDEEDGLVSPTDVIAEEEADFNLDDVEEAKKKLPYLLKLLYDGSIKYKGSLLSFTIAVQRFFGNSTGEKDIKPSNICNEGVYHVDKFGNITSKFVIEENSGEILRTLIKWATGQIDDRYYRASQELLRVCTILGLDIRNEDAKLYTKDVIDDAVCMYIASNEEYLEDYGFANSKLITALSPEEILKVAKDIDEDTSLYKDEFAIYGIVDDIATAVAVVKLKRDEWWDNPREVSNFLSYYHNCVDKDISDNIRSYDVSTGILRGADGAIVLFSMSTVQPGDIAVLSTTGHLIRYEQFSADGLHYMTASKFMEAHSGGSRYAWKLTSV